MNKDVREYLIEVARGDQSMVFYGQLVDDNRLRIDLGTPEGQAQLSQILTEISTYESQDKRPMLTAVAINRRYNDQGPGFYELAESFGYGKKSDLKKKGWGKAEAERVRKYWLNEDNYRQFAKTETGTIQTNPPGLGRLFENLFNAEEYQWAKDDWWKYYIGFVTDVKKLQSELARNPKFEIDNAKLYRTLSEPIRSYESFMEKWLKEFRNGISSRGQSVLSRDDFETVIESPDFKAIAKLVISEPSPATYSLLSNWWYSNEEISKRPLLINRAMAACLPERLSSTVDNAKFWYVVNMLQTKYGFQLSPDVEWNWFTANEELTRWLDKQLLKELAKVSTDKLAQQIWRNIFVWLVYDKFKGKQPIAANELIRRDVPEDGYDQMPSPKTSFEGRDIDFEGKAKIDKELGDAGEELVKLHEVRQLENWKLHVKAKLVRVAKPGEGFDVYSFDKNGNEKFIEVKTTTGNWKNRFYLTRHELKFMSDNNSKYSIYRVFNFDEENNSGEFFELKGNVEDQLLKEPTVYEVVVKRKKKRGS
jgi:Domain of unknown function (DUF3883)